MPQEQDCVITIEDDDDDVVIIEDSESEDTDNRFSTSDMSTIQPNSQSSCGVEGLAILGSQATSQMNRPANLKRNRSNSERVKFIPLCKKRRPTTLREENMALQGLIKSTNRQVNQLCGIVSKMQRVLERCHGNCNSSLPVKRQKNCSRPNRAGTSLRSAAPPEPEQPVLREEEDAILRESLPLPQIISTHSLQPYFTPGSPFPGISVLSYFFREDVESVINVVSSGQASLAVPTEILPQGEPRVANNPEVMNYPSLLENKSMSPDSTSSSHCIPPNFEMLGEEGTSLETSSETMNCATSLGNDSIPDTASSLLSAHPSIGEFEIIHITEIPGKAVTCLETNRVSMDPRALLGNEIGPDAASSSLSVPPNFDDFEMIRITEMPGKADTCLETNRVSMDPRALLGNESGPDAASSSLSIPPNFDDFEMIRITEMPGKADTNLETHRVSVDRRALLGNESGPDTASSSLSVPPNFDDFEMIRITEMPGKADTCLETNRVSMDPRALLGNESGPDAASSSLSIPPNFDDFEMIRITEMPGKADTSLETHRVSVDRRALLGNESGPDTASSSLSVPPNFDDFEMIRITEMLVEEGTSLETSCEATSSLALLGNESGPDKALTSLSIPPNFEMLGEEGTSLETSCEAMRSLALLGNESGPDNVSSSLSIPPNFAQKKTKPKHAARYLVGVLFSKEIILHCSSVDVTSQGRQPLEANKMAAIREYLATIFPNHDLSENGKDWKICISDISSLIRYLCSEAKGGQKTVDRNTDPVNPDKPTSAVPNDMRDDSESSSLIPQQTAALEARENGDSQQNSNVVTGGIIEPSTENSVIGCEALEYFGNPCRNIQMPYSVLNIAKGKSRPELSARYLIRNLFTEKVLIKSNAFGNLGRGMCALNSNRIDALREFLQDIYLTCDLSETGYDWKLYVTAINSSIRSLRYDLKKAAAKVQPLPATTPSKTKSEPRDADN